MIFLHHYGGGLFDAGGALAVSFFMILSGFVMAAGYGSKALSNDFAFGPYIKKRLIRIYPLHLLCLLICARKIRSLADAATLVPNVLLLQSWVPVKEIYFSGNAVAWCLSDMFFFYLAFPLIIRLFEKRKSAIVTGAVLLVSYVVCLLTIPESYTHAFFYINPLFRLLDFILGILCYKIFEHLEQNGFGEKIRSLSFTKKTLLELAPIVLLVLLVAIWSYVPDRIRFASLWWLVIPAIIVVFSLTDTNGGGLNLLLHNKLLVALGKSSFTFYMIHAMGFGVINKVLDVLGLQLPLFIHLPLSFVCVCIVAFIVFRYFETPITKKLSKLI